MLRYIYAVLLLTSTKTKVECVAVYDTLFMLNMNLKFSPSFVKLARFGKLKGKVCTWYHVSWLYLYELNWRGVTEFLLLHIASWIQSMNLKRLDCLVHAHAVIFPTPEAACVYLLSQVCTHASNKHMSHMFPQICCLHCYAHVQIDLLCLASTRTALNRF
jgi:hypothetical protein